MADQKAFQKSYRDYKGRGGYGRFVILGSNYVAGVVLLGYLGNLLDRKTGHDHLFMVSGAILGIIWATYEAFKIAFRLAKEAEAEMKLKKEKLQARAREEAEQEKHVQMDGGVDPDATLGD